MSTPGTPQAIQIRPAEGTDELEACVQLEVATWGYDASDIVPRRLFSLATRIGGQVLGAFAADRLVGFLLALPGLRHGRSYLHSHMLAVVPELARGVHLIEWTFDPLVAKNAYLNLHRLGAIARRYAPDFYGPTSSPLQAGLPTDRLYAEWWLRSRRVVGALARCPVPVAATKRVPLPAELDAWKAQPEGRAKARALQASNAWAFEQAFAEGLSALGYESSTDGGNYLLGVWDEAHEV